MESARVQLARPLATLYRNGGTTHPSVHNDRVALAYMGHWASFTQDVIDMLRSTSITHEVPMNNESENYVVGSELGLSGRFVRNLCDPVIQALMPLPEMSSARFGDIQALMPLPEMSSVPFGDIQALISSGTSVPDIAFGLVVNLESSRSPDNISLVGEFKTPWTTPFAQMEINRPDPHQRLETLIGQVATQMRMAQVKYGFLTTYNFTVFVKRASDLSYVLSQPIGHDCQGPSLREMFVGFCLLSRLEPNYRESDPDIARKLKGPAGPRASERLASLHPRELPSPTAPQPVTSTSVAVDCGTRTPVIARCLKRMSPPENQKKAVWLAEINGSRRVLKCWAPELDESFDNEAAVYDRLETSQPVGCYFFPRCLARGKIVCSSLFPVGYAIVMEYREGERLSDIWHLLDISERAHIRRKCAEALQALREISIRLDDAGKHNILYARGSQTVTFLDFEVVVSLAEDTFTPSSYEMGMIFM